MQFTYRGNLGCLWILLGLPLLFSYLLIRTLGAGGFFFLILALFFGARFAFQTIRRRAVKFYTEHQTEKHNRFVEMLVDLLVRLAEVDGPIQRSEVTAIRTFFETQLGYKDEKLLWVRDLIKDARESTTSIDEICARLAEGYGLQERFIVLQVLEKVARADGNVSEQEKNFIVSIANKLGLAPFVGGGAGAGFGGGPEPANSPARVESALTELGLTREASPGEIKSAWRQLSRENHPDRVTHLGEEFRKLAEDKMVKINGAYDTLKAAGLAE